MTDTAAPTAPDGKIQPKGVSGKYLIVGFIPWIAMMVFSGPKYYLYTVAFAAVSAIIGVVYGLVKGRGVHQLSVSAAILFSFMLVATLADPRLRTFFEHWGGTISQVGLVVMCLVGIAVGRPFTLYYAKQSVDPVQYAHNPQFRAGVVKISNIITLAWGASFAVGVACDVIQVLTNQESNWIYNWGIPMAALFAAVRFTMWYPNYAREKIMREHPEYAAQHAQIAAQVAAADAADTASVIPLSPSSEAELQAAATEVPPTDDDGK